MLLELFGLERYLPLHLCVYPTGRRLPGLHVRGHLQVPAAKYSGQSAAEEPHRFPQGKNRWFDGRQQVEHNLYK